MTYIEILLSRSGVLAIIGAVALFLPWHWAHFLAFVFLFNSFDVWGFKGVGKFETGTEAGIKEYRLIQIMFQAIFVALIYQMDGIPTAVACMLGWWLLCCDVLFYFALGEKLTPFTWALWSPVNAIYKVVFKEPTPVWAVLTSAVIGLVVGLTITFVERY